MISIPFIKQHNECLDGYLLRTKLTNSNEGGIMTGTCCVDSLILI